MDRGKQTGECFIVIEFEEILKFMSAIHGVEIELAELTEDKLILFVRLGFDRAEAFRMECGA